MSQTQERPLFDLRITREALLDVLKPINAIVDECIVSVKSDGIRIRTKDPANVAMTDVTLDLSEWEQFDGRDCEFGLEVSTLVDVLTEVDRAAVELSYKDDPRSVLVVSAGVAEVTLSCLDPSGLRDRPDLPDLSDSTTEVQIGYADLQRSVALSDMVSSHIRFHIDPDEPTLSVCAEGDTHVVDLEYQQGQVHIEPGPANSVYSLDYMKDLVGAIPEDTTVTLRVGEEWPILMEYHVAHGAGDVAMMMAPRVMGAQS